MIQPSQSLQEGEASQGQTKEYYSHQGRQGIRFEEKGRIGVLFKKERVEASREEGATERENPRVPHHRVPDCSIPRTPTSEPMVIAIVQAHLEVYGHTKVRFA